MIKMQLSGISGQLHLQYGILEFPTHHFVATLSCEQYEIDVRLFNKVCGQLVT